MKTRTSLIKYPQSRIQDDYASYMLINHPENTYMTGKQCSRKHPKTTTDYKQGLTKEFVSGVISNSECITLPTHNAHTYSIS